MEHERSRSESGDQDAWPMRLNKYIAHCGICSRRNAILLVKNGEITLNDQKAEEPGVLVSQSDVVKHKGKIIKPQEQKIYLLMNKPKNTITTLKDERGRRTVIDLIKEDFRTRLFPVGRLDRDTTGLLLLTNDGDLAQKLSHPSHKVKKIYYAELDKPLHQEDMDKILAGLTLEDGVAKVDGMEYVEGGLKSEVGIEIHIGKNRVVRRIFEHLGYQVKRLDRVYYAGLTKKDLPRGYYRRLNEQELIMLRHFI